MRPVLRIILLIQLLIAFTQLFGQESIGPDLQVRFRRVNNFTWTTFIDSRFRIENSRYELDWSLHHDNLFNSALDQSRFVQVYFRSNIWQYYRLGKKLRLANWFDTDAFFSNQTEKYTAYLGLEYQPHPSVRIKPMLGYGIDRRGDAADDGFSPALFLDIEHEFENGLLTKTNLMSRYKHIDPRRHLNLSFSHSWFKSFEENSNVMVRILGGSHELDNYVANSVQKTITDTISPALMLNYEFVKGFSWNSVNLATLSRRRFVFQPLIGDSVEINTKSFRGMDISIRQELNWRKGWFRAKGFYHYQYLTRFYDLKNDLDLAEPVFENRVEREKEKDFLRNIHQLGAEASIDFIKRHRLKVMYLAQYFQYDTPSEVNYDDRDEISYLASATWETKWNQSFSTDISLSGNYRHFAFLLAEKSQDNYKQRSLRMDFSFQWDLLKNLRVEGSNAVYVTYNVKDFEDFNQTDRSTRNLETNFRAWYRPLDALECRFTMNRKEFHQSFLNWEAFAETTLDTTRFTTIESSNRYYFKLGNWKKRFFGDLGYKHFRQRKMARSAMFDANNVLLPITLHRIISQTGPVIGLGFKGNKGSGLDLNCWFQVFVSRNRFWEGSKLTTVVSPEREENLKKVTQDLRPFLALNLSYNYFF